MMEYWTNFANSGYVHLFLFIYFFFFFDKGHGSESFKKLNLKWLGFYGFLVTFRAFIRILWFGLV